MNQWFEYREIGDYCKVALATWTGLRLNLRRASDADEDEHEDEDGDGNMRTFDCGRVEFETSSGEILKRFGFTTHAHSLVITNVTSQDFDAFEEKHGNVIKVRWTKLSSILQYVNRYNIVDEHSTRFGRFLKCIYKQVYGRVQRDSSEIIKINNNR